MLFSVISVTVLLIASAFSAPASSPASNAVLSANDLKVLQYALTLEHIENSFYTQGQAKFSANDFTGAGLGLTADDYNYFGVIRQHENAHVQFLESAISGLTGSPVTPCASYNFAALTTSDPFSSVASYIAAAEILEAAGVRAYAGAITSITSKAFITAAATIHSVEARHAQYLAYVFNKTDTSQFVAFNPASSPTAIASIVQVLNATCAAAQVIAIGLPDNLYDGPNAFPSQMSYTQFSPSANKTIVDANDVALMQYALYLEYFEAAFYANFVGGAQNFAASDYTNAGYSSDVLTYLTLVKAHEQAHVDALTSAISNAGATPISQCTYNFTGITTVPQFIATAATIEPVGVAAYNGAAAFATNRVNVLASAAAIVAVEARHASVLALFADQVAASAGFLPFPNVTDAGRSPADTHTLVLSTGLITEVAGCVPSAFPMEYDQTSTYTDPTPAPSTSSTSTSTSTTSRQTTTNTAPTTFASVSMLLVLLVAVFYL